MSKREWLARGLERSGAASALLAIRRHRRSHWLPILTFHRVRASVLDAGVHDATPAQLERCLVEIRAHFTPITTRHLADHIDGQTLPPNPVMVTFDDGYLDSHDVALPILRRHGVPAVFFIATQHVTEHRVFWSDRICYLVRTSKRERLDLEYPERRSLATCTAIPALLAIVKTWFDLDLPRFLADVARAAGVAWDDDLDRSFAATHVMTWDHVRALRDAGMDVQSHTHTHRVLSTLPTPARRFELCASRDELRRELGAAPRAMSYPVGYDIDLETRGQLAEAGYRLGFTNCSGAQPIATIDPFAVHRIGQDLGTAPALARATLAAPAVFAAPRYRPPRPRAS